MSKPPRARSRFTGFTLAEVLVVLAILAIMAAVLMPVLTNQLRKGDIGRVIEDTGSVQTAMEAFLSDVRRIPGDLEDLIAQPTAASSSVDADVSGDGYPSGLVDRWRGPYLAQDTTSDGHFPTGFGGRISTTIGTSGTPEFAILTIVDLTAEEFEDVDLEIDGETNSTTGRLRYDGTNVTFRLMPTGG